MNYVLIGLAIALALSVGGNAYQYHEHTIESVRFGTTDQIARDTKAAAGACTASVADLAKDGKERDKRLGAAIAGLAPRVVELQTAAMKAQQARPDDPKDLCGSLVRYLGVQIKTERAKEGR